MSSIKFITFASFSQRGSRIDSDFASARYRVLIPSSQLARFGHKISLASIPDDHKNAFDPSKMKADVVVFSKSVNTKNESLAHDLRTLGCTIVIDLCDNYLDPNYRSEEIRQHTIKMCKLADIVIASTPSLSDVIRERTGASPIVITDPVEGPRRDPLFEPRFPQVKALWFGHQVNWNSLVAALPSLSELARTLPIQLEVVTSPTERIRAQIDAHNICSDNHLKIFLTPWNTDAVWSALARCDVVIIPALDSGFHSTKSPNRLTESLWAGRMVIAHPLSSYQAYADYAILDEDISRGIRHAVSNSAMMTDRIRRGQETVGRLHSPYVIGSAWEAALGIAPVSRPLRLNLGCGDKILPDYVNVDVVESRKGMKPDVLCDLHHLTPFADNSADEILSVHVVEHFWRWEVRDVLKEWVRVLKPGARMILECPNLESACKHFLDNPELHSREDQNGQRSMWVFYGDPSWKDPYMIHRWGYTPESLADLMCEVGLTNIKQEPAQYKLREPRDMRLTGIKPA